MNRANKVSLSRFRNGNARKTAFVSRIGRYAARFLIIAFVFAIGTIQSAFAGYYASPYRFDYAYGENPWFPTIQQVLDYWWAEYQLDYSYVFPGCSYSSSTLPNPEETGKFVSVGLQGTCGGGGTLHGFH